MTGRQSTARVSPLSTALLIFGIIFLGASGPIGIALLVGAWVVQRRYRSSVLEERAAVAQRAREKARDRQLAAARNF